MNATVKLCWDRLPIVALLSSAGACPCNLRPDRRARGPTLRGAPRRSGRWRAPCRCTVPSDSGSRNATTWSMSCSMSIPVAASGIPPAPCLRACGPCGVELLAKVRFHDVLDVGVGDEDGVGGHVLQFGWAPGLAERPHGHSCVIRDEPRAEPDEQHRHRAEHEVAGPLGHSKHVL